MEQICTLILTEHLKFYYPFPNEELDWIKALYNFHNINKRFEPKYSFNKACAQGDLNNIKYYVENGMSINHKNGFCIITACKLNRIDIVDYALSKGALINVRKNSPFRIACRNHNIKLINKLMPYIYTCSNCMLSGIKCKHPDMRINISARNDQIFKYIEHIPNLYNELLKIKQKIHQ